MVSFIPMSAEDFTAFVRKSIPEYAYDQTRAGNWTADEAAARARSEFQQMLPDGPQTHNACLRTILDERGEKIGMLWYYIDPTRTRKTAFLIDFFLFDAGRRQGYEAQALHLFEQEARGMGVERVELQVFTHKLGEVELYRQNGFTDTSIFFSKDISARGNS